MSKVMLVEDDDALREVYSIRLTAEGYTIVTARDGEEALAIAVRERPDLVVSDVMMPKITGFDMLDILRSTPETQNIKVIMMTALSSEEERQRGERLGADRYLVKSQVGIEDVVNAVHEVLGDRTENGMIATQGGAPVSTAGVTPEMMQGAMQAAPQVQPVSPQPTQPVAPPPAPVSSLVQQPIAPQPVAPQPVSPTPQVAQPVVPPMPGQVL